MLGGMSQRVQEMSKPCRKGYRNGRAHTGIFLLRSVGCGALFATIPLLSQTNNGELHIRVLDLSGRGVAATVSLLSEANQYWSTLQSNPQGELDVRSLPYGLYQVRVTQPGFAPLLGSLIVRSSLPDSFTAQLRLQGVTQTVSVNATTTLIDPEQAGFENRIGSAFIQDRLASFPGRSLQDLINSQPGWLYEGNAVLHPRGSEYQTQFVVDGLPLTDNRSPSFGPEIEADNVQSIAIYTAGIPAEYGRKLGGVVELNTTQIRAPGLHGKVVSSGGSFDTAGAFAEGQYTHGKNTLEASANGSMTSRYLNPVVQQNYSNTGTLADFSSRYERDITSNDRLSLSVRHELSRYDLPNEQLQEAAGQRQTADNLETTGIVSFDHDVRDRAIVSLRGMVRDNANDFSSNANATPIQLFQHNHFREGYFKGSVAYLEGRQEWKAGIESDNTFLHENTSYQITDPTQFHDGTPTSFAFTAQRPNLEQAAFVQDQLRLGKWNVSAGLRWDHYQFLLDKQAFSPRIAISRYFPSADLLLHFSYDRIFQTPSSQNLLLSSSPQIESLDPSSFFRLPVQPSRGNYYEAGVTKAFFGQLKLDANYFRRAVSNYADDEQIQNTTVSFPISFRKGLIYGAEGKLEVPGWGRLSGFASYSYEVGRATNPVTGGLFLGDNATTAQTQLAGHFPVSQDQRNTVRARLRYQLHPRFWIASGFQYDSGLPFEFDGVPSTVLAQYGQDVLDRINFDRGRILPAFQVSASAGVKLKTSERLRLQLQVDGQNLTNVLDVIDFGGLFSGNAIGPSRNIMLRLTTTF